MIFQMIKDVSVKNRFKDFREYASESNWEIVRWIRTVTLLRDRLDISELSALRESISFKAQ